MRRKLLRWALRLTLVLTALAVVLSIAAFWILRTQWLRKEIRTRIIAEAEKATGGKVELKKFDFDPSTLRVSVDEFILRGKEPATDPPLASVEAIRVGVKVVSFLRRDAYLESLHVAKPKIRIVTLPDGTTNIPGPKLPKPDARSVFEQFVAISARHFELTDGVFEYDNQRVPISLRAENLRVNFAWEKDGPRYRGNVSAAPFHFDWPVFLPMTWDADVQLTMDKSGLRFEHAQLKHAGGTLSAKGTLTSYRAPVIDLEVEANLPMAAYVKTLKLPLSPEGSAQFAGKLHYEAGKYLVTGAMNGAGLAMRRQAWSIEGVSMKSGVRLEPQLVTLSGLQVSALGGSFNGSGAIRDWRDFQIRGAASGVALDRIRHMQNTARPFAWSGSASGPVDLAGQITAGGIRGFRVNSHLVIEPGEGQVPVEGALRVRYAQRENSLDMESSYLRTPRTRIDFQGKAADRMRVLLDSTDLNEFLPVMAFLSDNPPQEMPVQLDGGRFQFDGIVVSPLNTPRVQGTLEASGVVLEKRRISHLSATLDVDATRALARNLKLEQNGAQVDGDFQISLHNWAIRKEESEFLAHLDVRKASIEELLKDTGAPAVKGLLSGPMTIEGTLAAPEVHARLTLAQLAVLDETFPQVRMQVDYLNRVLQVKEGVAESAAGRILFRGRYEHDEERYDNGRLQWHTEGAALKLAGFETVRRHRDDLHAAIDLKAEGVLAVRARDPRIESLNGTLQVRDVVLANKPLGDLELRTNTNEERLAVTAVGRLLGTAIHGSGEWSLRNEASGLGEIEFDAISFARVREVLPAFSITQQIPFDGTLRGGVVFSGSIRKPQTLRARVDIAQFQLQPSNTNGQLSAAVVQELTLRNEGALSFEVDQHGIRVQQANLTGKDTNMQIGGGVLRGSRASWNVNLRGGLNLGIFQNYVSGLRTTGQAVVNATVRGAIDRPLLGGRMEIRDASVYHRDLTNGIDKATGVVAFDRNRALLQNFTAQSGGGDLKLNGFITFGSNEEPMSYRMNGQLERVRIRYPEGTSTTVNAALSLTGTADQSLVGGTVTVLRSGFTPRTDIGSLIFAPAKPVQTPTSSSLLRGMQFDVRVISVPNLQLETSLTKGVQAAVDIRLRGSPTKPVVLGTVSVNQGELNFFGTNYSITRGTVAFFNAARIEPVLDLDLETTVRAVTVNMNISGPVDKPNITYRSDPPLQTQDIIALLAVGRTPTGSTVASQTNIAGQGSGLYAGTETLLGQAVSAGVSSRLNRFFGVSRVKIDPQLVGLETTPQARLTIEQQFTRDITVTYVTNLTGALQQLVRLQWDIKKNWSVVGVRDENGVIGGDILFRKRFK
ncbi:MAG: translocation/assembly module TamB domain-containing protein [Bryobacterales bacterium]|nr:translocation/assembly module TamB domain-containing protein [Bryobacterales bacterium]